MKASNLLHLLTSPAVLIEGVCRGAAADRALLHTVDRARLGKRAAFRGSMFPLVC